MQPADPSAEALRLIKIYLSDHRAGAMVGAALAERMQQANRDSTLGSTLSGLALQIEEDRHTLDEFIDHLGLRRSRWKSSLAIAGERIGRLKLNGRMRRYSPLSRLEEFELLCAGIFAKRSLWRTLQRVFPDSPGAPAVDFVALERRADEQLNMLEEHRADIVAPLLQVR